MKKLVQTLAFVSSVYLPNVDSAQIAIHNTMNRLTINDWKIVV